MNNEHQLKIKKLPCWTGEIIIQPLSGGMTNHNYQVDNQGQKFVVRLGVDVPEHLLWRENEGITSLTAARAGFSPEVIHRDRGILVIRFIDGHVFTEDDVKKDANQARLADLLRRFHQQMPRHFQGYTIMFWVFQVLRHYHGILSQKQSAYLQEVEDLMEIASQLETAVGQVDIVFAHNDLLAANFIDDGIKIWLIDFDYAGFNSPLFDLSNLASNSELSVSQEKILLERYFDRNLDDRTWHSYNAMKCASLLRETMWSMVSEAYSSIEFDFSVYTRENRQRFESVYSLYQKNFE